MADPNEISTDLGEAFRDDDNDGTRNATTEPFIDFNNDGNYNGPDGRFNGVLCTAGSAACPLGTPRSIHVRRSLEIVFSGSRATITVTSGTINLKGCPVASGGETQVDLRIEDANHNPMPVGTTIVATTSNGTMVGTSSFVQDSNNAVLLPGKTHTVPIRDDATRTAGPPATCTDTNTSGRLTITVTTPGGVVAGTVTTTTFDVLN